MIHTQRNRNVFVLIGGLMIVMLLLAALPVLSALAANTVFFNANATVASNSVTNPNNGWTSNNQYATFNTATDTADYGFPDLGIPAGATIDGIEVTIEGQRSSGGTTRNLTAALWNTSALNPDAFTTAKTAVLSSSDVTVTLGGPTDKWGTTWTVADFADATFMIRVGATLATTGNDASLDAVAVKVYYTSKVNTTTSVSCASPITYGSSSSCTVSVTRASGSNTPTGNVSWATSGAGSFVTSPCALSGSGGTATCSVLYTPSAVGSGTHVITATYAGDTNFNGSNGNQAVTVNKADQTINVTTHAPANAVYNTAFTVAATASSGLAVSYSPSGVCTNIAGIFSMSGGTGTCTVQYDQIGNGNYNAASQVTDSVTAQKADQSINVLTHAPTSAVLNTSFTVTATSAAGLSAPTSQISSTVKTVFLILMENWPWVGTVGDYQILGNPSAPFLNSIISPSLPISSAQTSYASQYFKPPNNTLDSEPQYIWIEAGDAFGIDNLADPDSEPFYNGVTTTQHLVTYLDQAGISWRAYQEDIDGVNCPLTDSGLYAVRHEPFLYFQDVYDFSNPNPAKCLTHLRPYTELANDLTNNTVARYNFLTPNLCHDMHGNPGCSPNDNDGLIQQGDAWLQSEVSKIMQSQAYQDNGAILITWDNSDYTSADTIGMIVLSPLAKGGGYSNSIRYDHSSLLKTLQEIFGVGPILRHAGDVAGVNGATQTTSDLSDLFVSGAIPQGDPTGLPVTYSASGVCTNVDATFTMTGGTGTCTVQYDAAGDANYNAASQVAELVTAQKAAQTINVTTSAPASAIYNTSFVVTATASTGLPVSYSASGVCTNIGSTFTMISGTGTCIVQYDQSGNADYGAAPQITQTVTALKANQTINVSTHAPANAVFGTGFTVTATASSGLLVAYSPSGVCTNIGGTFTMTSGTGTCTAQYDQSGNANYNAAPQVTESVNAVKTNQTINVTTHAPANAVFGTGFTVSATASSGLAVTYSASGVCSNVGSTFTMTGGTGTCSVQYDQSGNANYNAAPQVVESTTAQLANTTTSLGSAPNPSVSGASVAITATVAPSAATGTVQFYVEGTPLGSPAAMSSGSASIDIASLSAGTHAITATYSGDSNFNPSNSTPLAQIVQPTLVVNIAGSGSVTKEPDQAAYSLGQVVTLTATPDAGWSFTGWSGNLSGNDNPATITMNDDKVVTATFTQIEYTLTTNIVGSGSVAKAPDQATYHYGDVITLTATPSIGWEFSVWSGDVTGGTNPTPITIDGNKTVTATFAQNQQTLTINAIGSGSVVRNPDQASYPNGSVVTLTATPAPGWSFTGWSGDLSGNADPTAITMDSDKVVTATFTQNEYTLATNVVGSGSVLKNPNQATYHYGDVVTVTAVPSAGWSFTGWSGNLSGNVNPTTVLIAGNRVVTATFSQTPYSLTVTTVGSGSVAKNPNQSTYHFGDVVTVTATPSSGWAFSGWSGDLSGSLNPTTISMDANKVVTATFTQIPYTLTANVAGSGSVNKNPNQGTYHFGDVVTVTAVPSAGWSFTGWTGDLSGSLNPAPITINGNKVVTATFTQNNPLPSLTSLNPISVTASSGAFTLTVNGTGFIPASVVQWDGANRVTTYVSSNQLLAAITAPDVLAQDTISVTVVNPAPGGGPSNALPFTISPSPEAPQFLIYLPLTMK